jgi:hypothetical protein
MSAEYKFKNHPNPEHSRSKSAVNVTELLSRLNEEKKTLCIDFGGIKKQDSF